MFKKQFTRLLSLIGIILISVGFVSGIGSPTDMIKIVLKITIKSKMLMIL